jgi:hypothetical protein
VLITAAARSRYEEAHSRHVTYLVTMGIRAGCFLVAVIVSVPAVRIAAIVGACILPYVAVVGANTVRSTAINHKPSFYLPGPREEVTTGASREHPNRSS